MRGRDNNAAIFVHSLIVILGIVLIVISGFITNQFTQALLLNLGCNLSVFTIIFVIFQIFNYSSDPTEAKRTNTATKSLENAPKDSLRGSLANRNAPISDRRHR